MAPPAVLVAPSVSFGTAYCIRRRPSVGSSGSMRLDWPGCLPRSDGAPVPSPEAGAPGADDPVLGDPLGMGMGGRCAPSGPGPPGRPGPPGMDGPWPPTGRPPGTPRPAPAGAPSAGESAGPFGAAGP